MAYGAVNAIIRDHECKLVTGRLESIIAIFLQPKEGRKVVTRVYLGGSPDRVELVIGFRVSCYSNPR